MEKDNPTSSGVIIRPKLLVPDKVIIKDDKGKPVVVRGTIEPPKKT